MEKINYVLDFRVGCNEQPMHQNIHTLYERLNSEQNFTQGIKFGDLEMETTGERERASKPGNHHEATMLKL